ncbi:MAG: outer membrane protein assembly factor BamE, partial [Pseudomonadota bacterium]|nr:outer membrane protein assembly factor BamE [Pseudomonadota bacterium]
MPTSFPLRYARFSVCAVTLTAALFAAGCQSLQTSDNFLGVITPYRLEVVQGNVITSEQAALVKPGLTRAQVRDILGSPLLTDPFHVDRWDYVFTIRRQGAAPQLRRVIVLFKNDVLASFDAGGELPSEHEFVASIDTFK